MFIDNMSIKEIPESNKIAVNLKLMFIYKHQNIKMCMFKQVQLQTKTRTQWLIKFLW